ncbi:hypothetical protein ACFCXS_15390 [Streptomyces sp. NPDC056373]|uniref:hypothetical protein n=1 Tax=Streptomyces sp. NPDC056373 TaxID=3345798 RepID=UPI0035D997D0
MPRIPDAVNVVSLDTHALIVAVPLDGPADVSSSLPRPVAADVLRQIADQLAAQPCPTAAATGQPCPIHDEPTAPANEEQPAADWVADVRAALAFNLPEPEPTLASLRDILLDTAPRTPAQALAAARIVLAAHGHELSTVVRKHADDYRAENGVTRGTRGLLTGMHSIRRLLDERADRLAAEAEQQ